MDSNQDKLFFISGFKGIRFGNKSVPSLKMILELIRPGACFSKEIECLPLEWSKVEDLGSQLLLQAYSNWKIMSLTDALLFKPVCEEIGINFNELRYHLAVLDYIEYFFIPDPDYGKIHKQLSPLTKIYYCKSIEKIEEENIKKIAELSRERKSKLAERFSEYKTSSIFYDVFSRQVFVNCPDDYFQIVNKSFSGFDNINQIENKNYRNPSDIRLQKYYKPYQCQYCHLWFEREQSGNGRERIKCDNDKCFKAWDSNRRRKKRKS
jgi:hypothetical protein